MNIISPLIYFLALPIGALLLRRLAKLDFREHKAGVILLHGFLLASVSSATYWATLGVPTIGDLFSVAVGGCWLWVSRASWREGIPTHYHTRPGELDTIDLTRVRGGKR